MKNYQLLQSHLHEGIHFDGLHLVLTLETNCGLSQTILAVLDTALRALKLVHWNAGTLVTP